MKLDALTQPFGLGLIQEPERDLLERARAGDGRAYRALVEPHLPMLFRLAARASGNPDLADDVVQDTLLIAFRKLGTFQPKATFKSYLAAIAIRHGRTLARSERRRLKRECRSQPPETLATPDEVLARRQLAQTVHHALAKLPKKRREAVMLRLDADLSYREIGQALGTSEGSARVLVHLAIKELKAALVEPPATALEVES